MNSAVQLPFIRRGIGWCGTALASISPIDGDSECREQPMGETQRVMNSDYGRIKECRH